MHCHSASVSFCARSSAEEIVEKYLEAGYTTIVSTEHLDRDTFWKVGLEEVDWDRKVDYFLEGQRKLQEAAKGRLHILLSAEVCLDKLETEFLLYGLTEDFLRRAGDIRYLSEARQLSELVRANGMLIFQSHPFRIHMKIIEPSLLDGIEIGNLSPNQSNNDIAQLWAERYNLTGITSTDYHNPDHTPKGGILTDYPITDNETLLKTLREKTFTPIWN